MIDAAFVTRKLTLILQDFSPLSELAEKSEPEYLANPVNEVLAERYLERMIGRMIDINFHLITELGHAPPKDYYESFTTLGRLGILPGEFAREIAVSAGLRNRIVHEYDDLDPKRVHDALQVAARHFPIYLDTLRRYIEKLPAE
jgi:uncharacterized protein YutE (UPF0331/DUF86 family)